MGLRVFSVRGIRILGPFCIKFFFNQIIPSTGGQALLRSKKRIREGNSEQYISLRGRMAGKFFISNFLYVPANCQKSKILSYSCSSYPKSPSTKIQLIWRNLEKSIFSPWSPRSKKVKNLLSPISTILVSIVFSHHPLQL